MTRPACYSVQCDQCDHIIQTEQLLNISKTATAPLALLFAHYGPGRGAIHLDELDCGGNEESLLDCPHIGVGNHNCRHYEDAGVDCTSGSKC